jgi:hypothetical protein
MIVAAPAPPNYRMRWRWRYLFREAIADKGIFRRHVEQVNQREGKIV